MATAAGVAYELSGIVASQISPGHAGKVFVSALGQVGRNPVAMGYSVGTASATVLDGVTAAWFPSLYGHRRGDNAGGGSVVLLGAGVGLVLAFLRNRR